MSFTSPPPRASPGVGGSVHAHSPAVPSPAPTDTTSDGHHRCCVCFGDIAAHDTVAPADVPCHHKVRGESS
jgi:hypothetical protein